MTEDDTFNKLKRMPFREMEDLYTTWWLALPGSWSEEMANEFLKPTGWTYQELVDYEV